MAEYFESHQAAVDAIKNWHKEFNSTPLFFGKINLYGSEKWIVDYKVTGYANQKTAFTVLEDLTAELNGILRHPSSVATDETGSEPSRWRELFKQEMLRFLTSPRTKEREQQTGDWWSRDNLKLVVAKEFSPEVEGSLLFQEAEAAIDELVKERRITGTASGYRAL